MFTHFYSDPHFGHNNIRKYAERPFNSTQEMNKCLIEQYNEKVGVNDYCLWLGDVTLAPQDITREIISALNGTKVLIKGNHDEGRSNKWFLEAGFSAVVQGPISLLINNTIVRANHYPYKCSGVKPEYQEKFLVKHKGEVLLHGHTHRKEKIKERQIHVGVDAWDYYPVSIHEVEDLIRDM